ncbi:hypothetical protein HYH03_008021 [Edaphochlamys debaryana]|uniref:Uncharacterized protein n=1 Tax=Edaphochlamys debaryana TaxID=47281 RepID=A0A835XZC1_9CHLO|nr:hypothetical protein HYH03_008021 [Edaphochlamys debaryana]|eukprot:KAG2493802.1 hypothetical protein HYH03_008021 [Edaphochlamys debaryana]
MWTCWIAAVWLLISTVDGSKLFPNLAENAALYQSLGYEVCPDSAVELALGRRDECKQLLDIIVQKSRLPKVWPPPTAPPEALAFNYTLGSRVRVFDWYIVDGKGEDTSAAVEFPVSLVEAYLERAKGRSTEIGYGVQISSVYAALDAHPLTGACAVHGTQEPWVEGILFARNAKSVLTVEYKNLKCTFPDHRCMMPPVWAQAVADGKEQLVDLAVSYSSWEHDGLGRYGDPVDPFGDLITTSAVACSIKPGGLLLLAVPVAKVDCIAWNAHRVYGPVRLPLLLANFEVLGAYWAGQSFHGDFAGFWEAMPERCEEQHVTQPLFVLRTTPHRHGCKAA